MPGDCGVHATRCGCRPHLMRLGSASAASRLVVPSWMAAPSVKRINSKRRCVQLVSKWSSRWIESRPAMSASERPSSCLRGGHARCWGPCRGPCRGCAGAVSGASRGRVSGTCRGLPPGSCAAERGRPHTPDVAHQRRGVAVLLERGECVRQHALRVPAHASAPAVLRAGALLVGPKVARGERRGLVDDDGAAGVHGEAYLESSR